MEVSNTTEVGEIFRGYSFLLIGFSKGSQKIEKMIENAGGKICNAISNNVTHVLVHNPEAAGCLVLTIRDIRNDLPILHMSWLEESFKAGRPANVKLHLHRTFVEQSDTSNETRGLSERNTNEEPVDTGIASKVQLPLQTVLPETAIFGSLKFYVTGFGDKNKSIMKKIVNCGGEILLTRFIAVADYSVVPNNYTDGIPTSHAIVTDSFIDDCVEMKEVVRIKYYHYPIMVPEEVKPLNGKCLVISGYSGTERTYVTNLSTALGAKSVPSLTSVENQDNACNATHMICQSLNSEEYEGAMQYGISAVSIQWLNACFYERRLVNVTPYLIKESEALKRGV